jgi:tetratricopeptide (TPR) repeat protein
LRFVVAAAHAALDGHAPEEALRLIGEAGSIATSPSDRAELLCLRDDALAVLGRDEERLAALAELANLARALGDGALELGILLRRAEAARATGDDPQALQLAWRARAEAQRAGDHTAELRANLELGQAMLRSPLGESFEPPAREGLDFEGAAEAFGRARALAEAVGDLRSVAAAERELAVVELGRAKLIRRELTERQVAAVETFADPRVRDHLATAQRLLGHALELYERLGDRRGSMSALIALAYTQPPAEMRRGEAGRIEQVRRLRVRLRSLTTESEEATNELQMMYGVQVYARANGYPDLALERGRDAHGAARALGDRFLEFLAACGLALSHLELGEIAAAEEWLDRAGTAALAQPSLARERQLELCRGLARVAAGSADHAMGYLRRAVALGTQYGSPATRSETLAAAALASARLGTAGDQPELLDWAETCASESRRLAAALQGPLPWEAQAFAASARVALARGDTSAATESARSALACLRTRTPVGLHAEIRLIVAQALLAGGAHDEAADARARLRAVLRTVAERILDDDVRARWFAAPFHAELAAAASEEPSKPPLPEVIV